MILDLEISLGEFCANVGQMPTLRRARIACTQCFVAQTKVRHRYLILALVLPGGQSRLYLRIDRQRAPGGRIAFVSDRCATRAYDRVGICP